MSGTHASVQRKFSLEDALKLVPTEERKSVEIFRHGTLQIKMYAPRGNDDQTPHSRDEIYVVAQGTATYRHEGSRQQVVTGDVLFAAAGEVHRFEDLSGDFYTWVFFYGPEGGER